VVRTRRPVVLRSLEERNARYPRLRGVRTGPPDAQDQAFAFVPMLLDDEVVGVLVLGWPEPRDVPGADLTQLAAIARHCAQALDRAELYEAAVTARCTAERTAERLRLQQELTTRLSGALDTEEVARVILEYAGRALGAATSTVFRVDARADVLRLVATHGLEAYAGELTVMPLSVPYPVGDAVRTGRTVTLRDRAERDERYPAMKGRASEALACVPLPLEGRVIGVLTVTFDSPLELSEADHRFLDAVAHQCAQAFERARLYDSTHSVASTLQRSLLPASQTAVAGLDVAARYRPVGRTALVGGDFYDVFRIVPGCWGVVIGDVSGKGIAAASLTSLARHTVRAAARREPSPAEVLGFLNEAVLEGGADERFCTVVFLEVRPGPQTTHVRFSIGGHPLPLVRRAGGTVETVGRPGMAIGLLPMVDVSDHETELRPGDALVLFTDGVAEARSPDGAFAPELVEQVLRRAGDDDDAQDLADRLERGVLDFQGGRTRDDLAILVLRMPADGEDPHRPLTETTAVTLACEPRSAGMARAVVRGFVREHGIDEIDDVEDTACLLVSELVTNAVLHARTAVGLRVAASDDRLRVEVSDGTRTRPVRQEFRPDATGGRGLLLLDRLAGTWDVRRTPDGKTVWFELALRPGA
jgi:serine phosphatase RsbU (regulator of sigma subunit)/anti-sigma regulatory factor (Ser/Thr protein kinase)